MIFNDRSDAGKQLALAVERSLFQGAQRVLKGNTLVVGLPRGGVPVALEVAQRLECPLQIIVSKKLPYPGQPEYAIGAVSSDGLLVLNPEIPQDQKWKDYIEQQRSTLLEKTLQMEEVFYRLAGIEKTSFDGKTVIIVDDGIATGMTAIAAAETARFRRAKKIITAAPIMSLDSYEKLKRHCDQVIAIRLESSFRSVSQFYRNFEQISNDEVVAALRTSSSLAQDSIYPRQARILNHSSN